MFDYGAKVELSRKNCKGQAHDMFHEFRNYESAKKKFTKFHLFSFSTRFCSHFKENQVLRSKQTKKVAIYVTLQPFQRKQNKSCEFSLYVDCRFVDSKFVKTCDELVNSVMKDTDEYKTNIAKMTTENQKLHSTIKNMEKDISDLKNEIKIR